MDLSEEQIGWLVEHFVHPGRAWVKLQPLERSLLDLGLVKSETFPFEDGYTVFVLSLTKKGWVAAIQYRPKDVEKYYEMFGAKFIAWAQMEDVSLAQLPELLSSDDELTQDIASIRLVKLLKDREDG
jgi:hypothetical protein